MLHMAECCFARLRLRKMPGGSGMRYLAAAPQAAIARRGLCPPAPELLLNFCLGYSPTLLAAEEQEA